jgi:hypothetical protein
VFPHRTEDCVASALEKTRPCGDANAKLTEYIIKVTHEPPLRVDDGGTLIITTHQRLRSLVVLLSIFND